jgi:hypothetical protein
MGNSVAELSVDTIAAICDVSILPQLAPITSAPAWVSCLAQSCAELPIIVLPPASSVIKAIEVIAGSFYAGFCQYLGLLLEGIVKLRLFVTAVRLKHLTGRTNIAQHILTALSRLPRQFGSRSVHIPHIHPDVVRLNIDAIHSESIGGQRPTAALGVFPVDFHHPLGSIEITPPAPGQTALAQFGSHCPVEQDYFLAL